MSNHYRHAYHCRHLRMLVQAKRAGRLYRRAIFGRQDASSVSGRVGGAKSALSACSPPHSAAATASVLKTRSAFGTFWVQMPSHRRCLGHEVAQHSTRTEFTARPLLSGSKFC